MIDCDLKESINFALEFINLLQEGAIIYLMIF